MLCMATSAWSAPDDPMLQMLQDRGLVVAESAAGAVRDVGHAASELVMSAMNYIDVRYRRGGNSAEEGFDCSGFTRHVFASVLGVALPHRSDEQARESALRKVDRKELQPGDLVFFNTMRRAFSHVGIYIGDGKFIHAPRSGAAVRVEDMQQSYWTRRFDGARRAEVVGPDAIPPLR
jgi:cell wall-associated NlpC family hydrolase